MITVFQSAPKPERICPLCGQKFQNLYKLHVALDKREIEKLKSDHPDWTEEKDICLMCINHYRSQFKLPALSEDEAARRWGLLK